MPKCKTKKYKGFLWVAITIILLMITAAPGLAGSDNTRSNLPVEEELSGFEDTFEDGFEDNDPFDNIDTDNLMDDIVQKKDTSLLIGGYVKIVSEYAFNKDNEKLSKLKSILFMETEYRISDDYKFKASGLAFYDASYDIEAKDKNNGSNLDDEPYDIELRDLFLDARLNKIFSVRAGRQIIAWGDSDFARITDVINPRDLTQPGLIDLEDARLPVTALRLSAGLESWSFDLVSIHEHPGSKISGKGADFDYFILMRNPGISIQDKHTPDFGFEDTGFALKATRAFNGGDISFVAANTYDEQPYLNYKGLNNTVMVFTPVYDRVTTYGISSSLAKGSSLFKFETALWQDRKIMRNDFISQISSGVPASLVRTQNSEDQILALAGVEYTGFSNLRLSFETGVVHTLNHKPYLNVEQNEVTTYFQATKNLLNETLALDLFWVFMNPGQGNILRLSTTYDIFDALSVQAGIAFYDSKNSKSAISPYEDRDRFFLRIKYSF
jgi:hypothetical protein